MFVEISEPMENSPEIRQHNTITTARYEYNEAQLNIFFYLLSLLRQVEDDGVYRISLKEMYAQKGTSFNTTSIKEATATMGSRVFEVYEKGKYKQLWMFDSVTYDEGVIEVRLSQSIRPYLFDLVANFTSFQLYSALRLTSKYAKRIYTLCSQWKRNGKTKQYEIIELKTILGLYNPHTGEEKMAVINNFKEKVLDIAVGQINETTDLRIRYEMKKEGRSFKYITFFVDRKELELPIPVQVVNAGQETNGLLTLAPVQSGTIDKLVNSIEARQDCPLNGSELRTALSALLAWGASTDLLNTFANNYEYLKRAKQYAYSVRMMDEKPIAPLAELIAELNI